MNLRSSLLLACAILTGCSAADSSATSDTDQTEARPKKPVFAEKAVNVDQSFSDAVKVSPDALVIPTSKLGKIEIGSIVAGDRASKGSDNPYGFLRRVTNIEQDGKTTTLVTEKAELSDWLWAGKIDFRSKTSLFSGKPSKETGIVTKTLQLMGDDKKAGGGWGEAKTSSDTSFDNVSISNTSVSVKASFDGFFEITRKDIKFSPDPPTGSNFKGVLTLDPSVGADITWTIKNEASVEKIWEGEDVLIPITAPIPLTVRYKPKVKCNISASGEAGITVGANISAHAVIGFEGNAGLTDFDSTNLSQAPEMTGNLQLKSIQGKATVSTECQILAVPQLLAFDTVGISGELGPYASLTATACANANAGGVNAAVTLAAEYGLTASFSGRVQIPILGVGKDFELWSGKAKLWGPIYLAGSEESCNMPLYDSCAGKADGFYCSELQTFSGIVCLNGQILKGINCENANLTCKGGDENTIQCE